MLALVDADFFCYAYGSLKENDAPMHWPFVRSKVTSKVEEILENTGATDCVLYLSGENNFRDKIWTIQKYKGNRDGNEKPHHYHRVKEYLTSAIDFRVEISDGYEADDSVSIAMYKDPEGTIGCHIDKDIDMVPGAHYNFTSQLAYTVSQQAGLHWFYTQLLMGDGVDHIPGLRGVGKVKAARVLAELSTETEMFEAVKAEYIKFFGTYWELFLTENARLLWMLRTPEDIWQTPTVNPTVNQPNR